MQTSRMNDRKNCIWINSPPDSIEVLELIVEAQTIPIIAQFNDTKMELALMRMTLNSLVEEVSDIRDEQHLN